MFTGDLKPDLSITLSADSAVDARDALSIRVIGTRGATILFDRPIQPADVTFTGGKSYFVMEWQAGDTDRPGLINGQVEVMWPGDKPQTFPFNTTIEVTRDADYTP